MNQMILNQLQQQIDLESTPAPVVCREIAEREQQMSETIQRLADAVDADADIPEVVVEDRAAVLLQASEAVMARNFSEWWWSAIAPEMVDNPDMAATYAGLSPDEWQTTVRNWYSKHHETGTTDTPLSEADPADIGIIADKHCRGVFGVSLREFVEGVVCWSPQRAVEGVLAGPTDEMLREFAAIVEELEES